MNFASEFGDSYCFDYVSYVNFMRECFTCIYEALVFFVPFATAATVPHPKLMLRAKIKAFLVFNRSDYLLLITVCTSNLSRFID